MRNNETQKTADVRRSRRVALSTPQVKLELVPPAPAPIAVVQPEKKEKLTGKHLGAKVGSVHHVVLTTKGERGVCAEFQLVSVNGARMLKVLAIDDGHPMDARVGDNVSVDSVVAKLLGDKHIKNTSMAVEWFTEYFRRMSGSERYEPRPREMKRFKGK